MLFRSQGNSSGNADNIAGTQSGGQGSCQGAEGGEVLGGVGVVFPLFFIGNGHPQGFPYMALGDVQFQCEKKMGSHQQKQEGAVPEKIVGIRYYFQCRVPLFALS